MASYSQKIILVVLIVAIALPISTAYRRRWRRSHEPDSGNTEQYLRDLCSETDMPDVCWNILKSELRRFDDGDITGGVMDLAVEKSRVIGDQLNQWYGDSNDDRLKNKYYSCSKNYQDINRNIENARRNLDSDEYRRISDQIIQDSEEELDECRREFGSSSFDPCHVGDRNKELGLYLDMVRVAIDHLDDSYTQDRARD